MVIDTACIIPTLRFTMPFHYENGEPVAAVNHNDEFLDDIRRTSYLKIQVNDIVSLGSGEKKKDYRVLKIIRSYTPNNTHFAFIVKPTS